MGKLKTHKSIAKRFKVTKNGKLSFNAPAWNHLKSKKGSGIKHRKNASRLLDTEMGRTLKRALPGVSNA